MASLIPSPPIFGLTSGLLPVATGSASIGNSTLTVTGSAMTPAGALNFNLGSATLPFATLFLGTITAPTSSLTLDSTSNGVNIGITTAGGVAIGRVGTLITIPGGTIRATTPGANIVGVNLQFGPGNGGSASGAGNPAANGGTTTIVSGFGGNGDANNAPANGANLNLQSGSAGTVGAFGGGANSGDIILNVGAPSGSGTSGKIRFQAASVSTVVLDTTSQIFFPNTTNTGAIGNTSNVWSGGYFTQTNTNIIERLTAGTLSIGTSLANNWTIGNSSVVLGDVRGQTLIFRSQVKTSGSGTAFTFIPSIDTGLANAEFFNFNFSAATQTLIGGGATIGSMRNAIFQPPTYAAAAAQTITTAATLAVTGVPIAGTNVTITSALSLWVQGGSARFEGDVILNTIKSVFANTFDAASATTLTIGASIATGLNIATGTFNGNITIGNTNASTISVLAKTNSWTAQVTGGTVTPFTFTTAANTGQTASTEVIGVNFNLTSTRQWATGALTKQREFLVQPPTYAFVGASTITDAVTLEVTGAPVVGTNATITNRWAFRSLGNTYAQSNLGAAAGILQVDDTVGTRLRYAGNGITSNGASTFIDQGARVAQNGVLLVVTGASLTNMPTATENNDVQFNFARTVQFATGNFATQRAMTISPPTYSFVGASTITTAATVAITGAPIQGTNATLTNSYALWVQSGTSLFAGSIISTGGAINSNIFDAAAATTMQLGPSLATNVQIGGAGNVITAATPVIQWLSTVGNAAFGWSAAAAVDTAGSAFTIKSQAGGTASVTGGGTAGTLGLTAANGGNGTASLNPGNGGSVAITAGAGGTGGTGNSNAGNVLINTLLPAGSGAFGSVVFQDNAANTIWLQPHSISFFPNTNNTGSLGTNIHIWNQAYATTVFTSTVDTPSAGTLQVGGSNSTTINFQISGSNKWSISSLGTLAPLSDNSTALGASDSNRISVVHALTIRSGITAAADTAGSTMTISAQAGGAASSTGGGAGGAIFLSGQLGGAGTGALVAGGGSAITLTAGNAGANGGGGSGAGGNVNITSGSGSAASGASVGGNTGSVSITGANGGAASSSAVGGGGGQVNIAGGIGAAGNTTIGGQAGGFVSLTGGAGGASAGTGSTAGLGSNAQLAGGKGGNGGGTAAGAVGGSGVIVGGLGGDGTATGAAGAGGTVTINGGAGGTNNAGGSGIGGTITIQGGTGSAGNGASGPATGGSVTINGGTGGAATTSVAGSAGQAVNLNGGTGGAGSASTAPGAGANVVIKGGAGGSGASGTANGGGVVIRGGSFGGTGGTNGAVTIGDTQTSAVNIGASGISVTIPTGGQLVVPTIDSQISGTLALGGSNATVITMVGISTLGTNTDNICTLGTSLKMMSGVYSYQYITKAQANTMAATTTITPGASFVKQTYASATNVTSMTISAGVDGQELTVMLIQPAAGTAATMVTSWTNVSFAGGTGSFTATLGKRDVYAFRYDGTTSKWYEMHRALNLTN